MNFQAIYVHIPFCKQKCLYCDFASYAGYTEAMWERYTDALVREITLRASEVERVAEGATIYFGGGTPSLLPVTCLERIVYALKEHGFWHLPLEATIEVNPGTVDLEKLRALRVLGFDRASFGVQSLQEDELRTIGRVHSAEQALQALKMAKMVGFERYSADVIYGLPGQNLARLRNTLEMLLATGLEHISVYGLIVEEGTPLERLVDSGKLVLPSEDEASDMYEFVQSFLREQGFDRYEISNYAKAGQYSRHNNVYWQYQPYLAFGVAACGFNGEERQTAKKDVREYVKLLESVNMDVVKDEVKLAEVYTNLSQQLYDIEKLSKEERFGEFMFMGLRRSVGVNLTEARERFSVDVMEQYAQELKPFLERQYLLYDEQKNNLRLSDAGMEIANNIFCIFI